MLEVWMLMERPRAEQPSTSLFRSNATLLSLAREEGGPAQSLWVSF